MVPARKKRVMLIIPNLDFGGAQTAFAKLSGLLDSFCEVLLVVFNKENMAPLPLNGRLVELEVPGSGSLAGKGINFIMRVRALRRIKKEFSPDVSISFLEGADYVNILSAIGEKVFLNIRGSKKYDGNISGFTGWVRKKLLIPFLYSKADRILVLTDMIRMELITHFRLSKARYTVVPNFYDIQALNALGGEPVPHSFERIVDRYPTICISGRIAPEKGIDRFVKLLPYMMRHSGQFKLIIVGEGAFKQEVIQCCEQTGLRFADLTSGQPVDDDVAVVFTGYQKNPYRFVKRCTMLALPSLHEGLGNTMAEAMSLGIPVIAADCPYGPRQLLSADGGPEKETVLPEFSSYGILLPVLYGRAIEKEAWASAISGLIHDHALRQRYAEAGRNRMLTFSKEENMITWRRLLDVNQ